ncbi:hypothetical protein BCON_0184g00240 [Botryotinia convoluta]|uniref:Uncharacterized protein n=1 Tax=Botryotinia convoluta TaxID=54673 RepID=A0A4Z1HMV0_9HELO|nr:hypothetical protein BCON_0184g00240 [Botryotinia convoluta]
MLITSFGAYTISIACAIYKGIVSAPEDDSDSSSDTSSNERDFDESVFVKLHFPMRSGSTRLRAMSQTLDDYENPLPRKSVEEDNEETGSKNTSTTSLALSLSLSTTVLGTTILSIMTTLPENLSRFYPERKNKEESS